MGIITDIDITTEFISDPIMTIKLIIFASCYIIFIVMSCLSVPIAIFWIILGLICGKCERPGGAKICFIIGGVIFITGLIIDIYGWFL